MNWAFKKYMFLLCILCVSGYGNAYAHSFPNVIGHFLNSNLAASDNATCEVAEELPTIVFEDPSQFEIQKPVVAEVADIEEEEEECEEVLFSPNKNLVYGDFSIAIYATLRSEHFSSEIKNYSAYSKPYTFTAPYKRYIRFQVFRI